MLVYIQLRFIPRLLWRQLWLRTLICQFQHLPQHLFLLRSIPAFWQLWRLDLPRLKTLSTLQVTTQQAFKRMHSMTQSLFHSPGRQTLPISAATKSSHSSLIQQLPPTCMVKTKAISISVQLQTQLILEWAKQCSPWAWKNIPKLRVLLSRSLPCS